MHSLVQTVDESYRVVSEGPQSLRFLFVSPGFAGRAGSFRACAEIFRQYLAEKIAKGELFRQVFKRRG